MDAFLATDIMEGIYSEMKEETEHSYPQPIQSAETHVMTITEITVFYVLI